MHPFSQSIAACITGIGLNAQTSDPNTTRSKPEISTDAGSITVLSSLFAILPKNKEAGEPVIGLSVSNFYQLRIKS